MQQDIFPHPRRFPAALLGVLAAILLIPELAWATDVTVDCTGATPGAFTSIMAALNTLDQQGPHTITVSGNCTERVRILNRENLTIVASNAGASIISPVDGAGPVVLIRGSRNIVLSTMGIQRGFNGVRIDASSGVSIVACLLANNANHGVVLTSSVLHIEGSTLQNNGGFGLRGLDNSTIDVGNSDPSGGVNASSNGSAGFGCSTGCNMTFNGANIAENNGLTGMLAGTGGRIVVFGGEGIANVVRGNSFAGVWVFRDAQAFFADVNTIENNSGPGVRIEQGAAASLFTATIRNNTQEGVLVVRLGTAELGDPTDATSRNVITGNGGASIACDTTALVFGDLTGITNITCSNVERPNGPPRRGPVQ
jgi:hypothetical protein